MNSNAGFDLLCYDIKANVGEQVILAMVQLYGSHAVFRARHLSCFGIRA